MKQILTCIAACLAGFNLLLAQDTIYIGRRLNRVIVKDSAVEYNVLHYLSADSMQLKEYTYYITGELKSITKFRNYRKYEMIDTSRKWYQGGQLQLLEIYKPNDELIRKTYWEDGRLRRNEHLKKDKVISGKVWDHKGVELEYFPYMVLPAFPGGDEKRMNYLLQNVKYPYEARENNISGTVYVSFIVEKDGKIKDAWLLRSVHPWLDEEALRVIRAMPNWEPGKLEGVPIRTHFNMPLKFTLQ